jgi:hypothetical protein
MVYFFFYENLTNINLIKKINHIFEIMDGYIKIQNYDREMNVLTINDDDQLNNTILHGKIVNFNMKLENIFNKIYEIDECKFKNKDTRYTLNTISANGTNGEFYRVNIIY